MTDTDGEPLNAPGGSMETIRPPLEKTRALVRGLVPRRKPRRLAVRLSPSEVKAAAEFKRWLEDKTETPLSTSVVVGTALCVARDVLAVPGHVVLPLEEMIEGFCTALDEERREICSHAADEFKRQTGADIRVVPPPVDRNQVANRILGAHHRAVRIFDSFINRQGGRQ